MPHSLNLSRKDRCLQHVNLEPPSSIWVDLRCLEFVFGFQLGLNLRQRFAVQVQSASLLFHVIP